MTAAPEPLAPTAAVSADALTIPLIDFSPFLDSTADAAARKATAAAILDGFQRAGFIYLRNHNVPRAQIDATFAAAARFFARPAAQKEALEWTTPEANRGYSGPGREKTSDAKDAEAVAAIREAEGADLKESLEIGREDEEGQPNRWPIGEGFAVDGDGDVPGETEGERFRRTTVDFFATCKVLHQSIMQAIALGLGIDENWFDPYTEKGDNTLRLLHYPEVEATVFKENEGRTVRAGAHTDYGSITCLFQDMSGGLQVLSPSGKFVDATPIADTIVVNAGDLLARWSNDTIRSTKHRVVEPPLSAANSTATKHPARYSIAYFCNPDFDRVIDAIPSTFSAEQPKKYESVKSGDYLVQRLSATY